MVEEDRHTAEVHTFCPSRNVQHLVQEELFALCDLFCQCIKWRRLKACAFSSENELISFSSSRLHKVWLHSLVQSAF